MFEQMDQQDTTFNLVILSCTLGISIPISFAILYKVVSSPTMIRGACFTSMVLGVGLTIVNITHICVEVPTEEFYWACFFAVTYIDDAVIVACILNLGRQFYRRDEWNTRLFKFTVALQFALMLTTITLSTKAALGLLNGITIGGLVYSVITLSPGITAFFYAFWPILTNDSSEHDNNSPDYDVTSVGVWYCTVIGMCGILHIAVFVVMLGLGGSEGKTWFATFAFDGIIRSFTVLTIAFPPPKRVVPEIRKRLCGHGTDSSQTVTQIQHV